MINLNRLIRHFQRLQNHQLVVSRITLLLSITVLFFCRSISAYTSNYNDDIWFIHFVVVERSAMLLLLLSVFKTVKKVSWLIGELLFFFLAQDIIDRLFFNVKEISTNDYIAISILIIIAIIKFKNKQNDNTRTNKEIIQL